MVTRTDTYTGPEINGLLNDLGLVNAYPMGVSLAGCANFASGLAVGSSLLKSGDAKNVLLVIVEKGQPGNSRMLDLGMSVLSDAVASCMLRPGAGDYEILRIGRASIPTMERLSLENDVQEFFASTGRGVAGAVKDALDPLGMTPGDVKRLFTNNYVTHIQQAFIKHAGFSASQCFFDNVGRFAHAFSADTLINLKDCTDRGGLGVGERCLLLGTSPTNWGTVVLQRQ